MKKFSTFSESNEGLEAEISRLKEIPASEFSYQHAAKLAKLQKRLKNMEGSAEAAKRT